MALLIYYIKYICLLEYDPARRGASAQAAASSTGDGRRIPLRRHHDVMTSTTSQEKIKPRESSQSRVTEITTYQRHTKIKLNYYSD